MPLTADQAAEVANRHGLTLTDAAALRALADDEDTADRIAAQFARPDAERAEHNLRAGLFDNRPDNRLDITVADPFTS